MQVPAGCTQDTLTAVYNDIDSVKAIFAEFDGQVAAVIVDMVAANMGCGSAESRISEELRRLCTEHGALLIFDEVITGFRLAFGGAQEYFGISADLVTYGKIIGAECRSVRTAEEEISCSRWPLSVLSIRRAHFPVIRSRWQRTHSAEDTERNPGIYSHMASMGERLFRGMKALLRTYGKNQPLNHTASLGCMYFTDQEVYNYETAKTSDTEAFAGYFRFMLEHGIPSGTIPV